MTRHAKRTDENQKAIVNELRSYGFEVKVTSHIGHGTPDILIAKDRKAMGIEIKVKGKRKDLTDDEITMMSWWESLGMKYVVAETAQEVIEEFIKFTQPRKGKR